MADKSKSRKALKIFLLCLAWYSFSTSNNILGKKIFYVFPYPVTICMAQLFVLNAFLGPSLTLLGVERAPHISRKFYIRRLIPLSIGKLFAVVSAHISILKVPVSYAHTIKAMMPIFTVFLSVVILRESFSSKVYMSLLPIVSGVLIATVTELRFDTIGLIAALTATLCAALQNIYSKKCMREIRIHHLRLLLNLSQLACVFLFPVWMYTDVWDIISKLHKVQHLGWLALVIPLNGLLNFGQNIVAFSMISAVSPVSYSVANATKRICVITFSLLMLKNPVTLWNMCGMATAIAGVCLYNKIKISEVNKSAVLPTTAPDTTSSTFLSSDYDATIRSNDSQHHVKRNLAQNSQLPLRAII